MEKILQAFDEIFSGVRWESVILGILVLVVGQVIIRAVQYLVLRLFVEDADRQKRFLVQKLVIYLCYIFLMSLALKIFGANLKMILGAAGVLTLAIGFAARTPISNLISGIFLIFERPFVVGDIIEVNEIKGEVLSIDLLAMTLRTLDNIKIRVPNEIVMGKSVRNYSSFPIRRLDLKLVFSYKESLTSVHKLLMKVAKGSPLALEEPDAYFRVTEFCENHIEVLFSVWGATEEFVEFQSNFPKEVHRALKNSGIDQPVRFMDIQWNQKPGSEPSL